MVTRLLLQYSLRTKLIVAFLMVALIPIGVLATLNYWATREALTQAANQSLFVAASQTATKIDSFITAKLDIIRTDVQHPDFEAYLTLPPEQRAGSDLEKRIQALLATFKNREENRSYVLSYALLDAQGVNLLDTSPRHIGEDESAQPYFQQAQQTGQAYVSLVEFPERTGSVAFYFSCPVRRNRIDDVIGVLRVQYSVVVFQEFVGRNTGLVGDDSFGILFDQNQLILAHGVASDLIFKLVQPLEPAQVADLQAANQLPHLSLADLVVDLPALAEGLAKPQEAFFVAETHLEPNDTEQVAVVPLQTQPWRVAFVQPRHVFLAPVEAQAQITFAVALIVGVIVLIVAWGLARLLTLRIVPLTHLAQQVAQGDLTVTMPAHPSLELSKISDETVILAIAFDRMVTELRDLLNTLEERVHQRTRALETSAEISRQMTTILDIDLLLRYVVNRVKTEFDFYHTHLYLVDETAGDLVMVEGSGEVGQQLKAQAHRLGKEEGIVGLAAETGQPILSNDVSQTPNFVGNPLLPETRSELAVPLRKGDQILGVLDIQSELVDRFTEEDISFMQSIANQTAITIDNARLLAETQATVVKLQELDQLKSEFLSSMSHELRTPLNAILGFADVLLEGIDGPLNEMAHRDVSMIFNSGKHLLALINDILDISKIEAGMIDLDPAPLSVPEVIHEILAAAKPLLKSKPVELRAELTDDLPPVYADTMRLRQILLNLLSNAIKFTAEGAVTVSVTECNSSHLEGMLPKDPLHEWTDLSPAFRESLIDPNRWLYFVIKDTGIGIPMTKQASIFERFKQADMSTTRKFGGTGLGLAICKQLVELHGGQIGVRSTVNMGSEFFFTMPLAVVEELSA